MSALGLVFVFKWNGLHSLQRRIVFQYLCCHLLPHVPNWVLSIQCRTIFLYVIAFFSVLSSSLLLTLFFLPYCRLTLPSWFALFASFSFDLRSSDGLVHQERFPIPVLLRSVILASPDKPSLLLV
jgi:hypothetical protein